MFGPLERIRGLVWLYPHNSYLQGDTAQCLAKPPQSVISPVWETAFLSCMGHWQRGPFPSHPIQSTVSWALELEGGRVADRTLRGHYRDMDPTHCVLDSIKQPASIDRVEWWFSGMGRWRNVGQRAQASIYKMNKFWGCNVQHSDYS